MEPKTKVGPSDAGMERVATRSHEQRDSDEHHSCVYPPALPNRHPLPPKRTEHSGWLGIPPPVTAELSGRAALSDDVRDRADEREDFSPNSVRRRWMPTYAAVVPGAVVLALADRFMASAQIQRRA